MARHEAMTYIKVQMEVDGDGQFLKFTYIPDSFGLSDFDDWEYVDGHAEDIDLAVLMHETIDQVAPKLAALVEGWV